MQFACMRTLFQALDALACEHGPEAHDVPTMAVDRDLRSADQGITDQFWSSGAAVPPLQLLCTSLA
jgi:hypothetical protein